MFLFALGTPLRQSPKTLHERKDNSVLAKPLAACTHLSSTVFQLFEPQVQKNCRFHVPPPTFLFLLETPLRLSRNMLHGWKDNYSVFAKPSQHVPIYIQLFPSYTMLKSMRKSKNRYFYHIFVSPGDASGTITLNVVCMEREFNAYKLPRCMSPSNYNHFWDRARYWLKIVIFHTPLHSTPPLWGFPSE